MSGSDDGGEHVGVGSDLDDDVKKKVVDTDDESESGTEDSDTTSEQSASGLTAATKTMFLHTAPVPSAATEPRATCDLAPRRNLAPLWSDEYFIVGDHPNEHVQVRVKSVWHDELAGDWPMTKQLQPGKYGETRADPVRCLLLLRAWALWLSLIHI